MAKIWLKTLWCPIKVPKRNGRTHSRESGFTLVEIMVALAIIALLYGVAARAFRNTFKTNLKSASRRLVGAIRFTFEQSALQGRTHRLVFDLDERKYWVEELTSSGPLYQDNLVNAERKPEKGKPEPPASPFKPVDKNLAKEQEMPSGVFVRDIQTENSKKAIKEGKAFIHFFPQGFVEPSVIHLQKDGDEETVYSLVVSPLTGKVTTYHEDVHPF